MFASWNILAQVREGHDATLLRYFCVSLNFHKFSRWTFKLLIEWWRPLPIKSRANQPMGESFQSTTPESPVRSQTIGQTLPFKKHKFPFVSLIWTSSPSLSSSSSFPSPSLGPFPAFLASFARFLSLAAFKKIWNIWISGRYRDGKVSGHR